MQPLRSDDPSRIADHRLLGRLGAGGMGVVYLARSPGGALLALKVIRPEYADDPGFRARFRREVAAARRVSSRWAVPVADADTESAAPWLASGYVPGPALGEVVGRYGPLPVDGVRALGHMLAEALEAVHGAGLVHRDVKPGNVLLALDGPRLIDFGIARALDDTAITTTDMVIGSPGFLSPEQAQAAGSAIGPPSDVFSLGAVLAHAASGRAPFGTGEPAALLYRTVHDRPDLAGVPEDLLPLLGRCLDKNPLRRPTATAVRRALVRDPRRADTEDWLPAHVVHLVAARSIALLALPDQQGGRDEPGAQDAQDVQDAQQRPREEDEGNGAEEGNERHGRSGARTVTPADQIGDAPPQSASDAAPAAGAAPAAPTAPAARSRRWLFAASGAVVLAGGGGLAAWAARRGSADGGDDGPDLPAYTIGVHGDFSGAQAVWGKAQRTGVQLAIEEFNAGRGRRFALRLKAVDDGGRVDRAGTAAAELVDDRSVLAVIGPGVDEVAVSAVEVYDQALLATVAVALGTVRPNGAATRSLLLARPGDALQALPIVPYLTSGAPARRTGLIDDRKADNYSWSITRAVAGSLRLVPKCEVVPRVLRTGSDDYGSIVRSLLAQRVDSLVFGGKALGAARVARAAQQAGFTGPRIATQAVLDPLFLKEAGSAAEGWVLTSTFIDPAETPAAAPFVAAYRKRFATAPPYQAVEAYDAARLVIRVLSKLLAGAAAGPPTRKAVLDALRAARFDGISKKIAFDATDGDFKGSDGTFFYQVKRGRFDFVGAAALGED
ncbi:bifunctional serine/threonine-protein kinase/ABC transporter substrate-binding protein [Streptomyces sp. HSW2009]|uniref:bifunctional serine/threonine-protein kinase/ABC transporter substrate-binding protein n=1 Tax=Streptomyces sp. HSW2009 TaxID=3142890 RepID=UPI0032EB59C2